MDRPQFLFRAHLAPADAQGSRLTLAAFREDGRVVATHTEVGPWPGVVSTGMASLLKAPRLTEQKTTYTSTELSMVDVEVEETVSNTAGNIAIACMLVLGGVIAISVID